MASKFNNLNEQKTPSLKPKTSKVIGIVGQLHDVPPDTSIKLSTPSVNPSIDNTVKPSVKSSIKPSVKSSVKSSVDNTVKTKKKQQSNTDKSKNDVGGNTIIFVGGRDDRKDKVTGKLKDKPLDEQTALLQTNVTGDVIPFRYTPISTALASLTKHPDAKVILFSAGCAGAMFFAKAMSDPTKLYIVEPYALSGSTTKSVRAAVKLGTPRSNVYVGNIPGRGLGIVEGASSMPTLKGGTMPSHWNALREIGKLI